MASKTRQSVRDRPNVLSSITSITIGGQVIGRAVFGDHFDYVAKSIGSLRVGGTSIPQLAGKSNDNKLLDFIFGNFRLREI